MANELGTFKANNFVCLLNRAILTSDTDPIEVWLVSTTHHSNADSAMAQAPDQAAEAQRAQQQPQPSGESSQQPADTRIDMQREQQQQEAGQQQQEQQAGAVRLQQGGTSAASAGERGGAMAAAGMTTPPARQMSPLFKTEDRPHLTGAVQSKLLSLPLKRLKSAWLEHACNTVRSCVRMLRIADTSSHASHAFSPIIAQACCRSMGVQLWDPFRRTPCCQGLEARRSMEGMRRAQVS